MNLKAKHIDVEAMAIALFSFAEQLEEAYPGMAGRHGWARLVEVEAFTTALIAASQATPLAGLH